jgi:ribosomal protein S18 acetylase RimI-like enzyme
MKYTVRAGRKTDAQRLALLEEEAFHPDPVFMAHHFRYYANRGQLWVVVGKEDLPLAYLVVSSVTRKAGVRIYGIATFASERGKGHATRLLRHIDKVIQPRRSYLEVSVLNHGAFSLYEAKGYRVFGRIPSYYADGVDALRMEKVYKH